MKYIKTADQSAIPVPWNMIFQNLNLYGIRKYVNVDSSGSFDLSV